MKKPALIAFAAVMAALSLNPAETQADDQAPEQQQSALAFELSALREAWLYGDDATAIARLDALREDNRLGGDIPRWLAGMRAALALEKGDTATALKVLQPVLDGSNDARNYLRASRLCLAYGADTLALEIIRQGRACGPDSRALMRFEAGLLWLGGDFKAALDAYSRMVLSDEQPNYPYVAQSFTRWSQAKPWKDAAVNGGGGPVIEDDEEDWGYEEPAAEGFQPEPFADLFMPIYWYQSDLPGLDRLLEVIAADNALVQTHAGNAEEKLKLAREAQEKVDNLRTGDAETRKQLEAEAKNIRWQAMVACRILCIAKLKNNENEACEKLAAAALAVAPEDIALLDLQAQAMGRLGLAEEARGGPLARLRGIAWLSVYNSHLYNRGPTRQVVDRVFEPALTLYRANSEAGLVQLEQMRTSFGDTNRNQPVYAGVMGLWLMTQGEPDLARKYLLEASRQNGYESGRTLYQDSVYVEMALISLGEAGAEVKEGEVKEGEGEKEVVQPKEEGEVDPLEIGKLDANTHPLLRKSLRAGAVLGSVPESRALLRQLAGVEIWSGYAGIAPVQSAARYMPEGDKLLQLVLWGLPAEIAANVPTAELEAFLGEQHITTQNLATAVKGLADLIDQSRTNTGWEIRQALSQRTGPVLGLIEARALLLRAHLLKTKPASLADLTTWLSRWQPQIDLAGALKSREDEVAARYKADRVKAGIPAVVHTGLLLDAARALARAGAHGDAARLLWFNRDAALGLETVNHTLALAAVLARKAGDTTLALRCTLACAQVAPEPQNRSLTGTDRLLPELPSVRADLLEFGQVVDLLHYIEHHLAPLGDNAGMAEIEAVAPEIKQARPTLVMRNTSRIGMDGIFSASINEGSCYAIQRNWYKMMISPETHPSCARFAAWVIASDLAVTGRVNHNGMAATQDAIAAWAMLRQLYARQSDAGKEAVARLDKLLARTDTVIDEDYYYEGDWWD